MSLLTAVFLCPVLHCDCLYVLYVCELLSYSGCWADGWWQRACCSSHTPARCQCLRGAPLGRGDGARCSSSPAAWRGLTPTQTDEKNCEKHSDLDTHTLIWYRASKDQMVPNCVGPPDHGDQPMCSNSVTAADREQGDTNQCDTEIVWWGQICFSKIIIIFNNDNNCHNSYFFQHYYFIICSIISKIMGLLNVWK